MKKGLALFLATALLAGCDSDDGDDDTAAETTLPPADTAVFESDRIGFSFEYPEGLVVNRMPRGDLLAVVGVSRSSRRNAIQVRQTAERELGPERYLEEFRRDLAGNAESVETRTETIGDLDVGVLEVEGRGFASSSYFFTGGGRTWQLECISGPRRRAEVDAACAIALGSIDFGD